MCGAAGVQPSACYLAQAMFGSDWCPIATPRIQYNVICFSAIPRPPISAALRAPSQLRDRAMGQELWQGLDKRGQTPPNRFGHEIMLGSEQPFLPVPISAILQPPPSSSPFGHTHFGVSDTKLKPKQSNHVHINTMDWIFCILYITMLYNIKCDGWHEPPVINC